MVSIWSSPALPVSPFSNFIDPIITIGDELAAAVEVATAATACFVMSVQAEAAAGALRS